jgi:hypothetical protein
LNEDEWNNLNSFERYEQAESLMRLFHGRNITEVIDGEVVTGMGLTPKSDNVSVNGGNTLGGPMSFFTKLTEWLGDILVAVSAPPPDVTGPGFSVQWANRKVNNVNRAFMSSVAVMIFLNPKISRSLVTLLQYTHRKDGKWAYWLLALGRGLSPLLVNHWYYRRTGAWQYTKEDVEKYEAELAAKQIAEAEFLKSLQDSDV